jgi:hypothetical protein
LGAGDAWFRSGHAYCSGCHRMNVYLNLGYSPQPGGSKSEGSSWRRPRGWTSMASGMMCRRSPL